MQFFSLHLVFEIKLFKSVKIKTTQIWFIILCWCAVTTPLRPSSSSSVLEATGHHELHVGGGRRRLHGVPEPSQQERSAGQERAPALQTLQEVEAKRRPRPSCGSAGSAGSAGLQVCRTSPAGLEDTRSDVTGRLFLSDKDAAVCARRTGMNFLKLPLLLLLLRAVHARL